MPVNYDMTIDETIEYLEKTARHQLECAEKLDELGCDSTSTRSIADYHKQLAEWLRGFKRYREAKRILSQNRIATDRYGEVVLWSDIKRILDEVNTDESMDE